MSLNIHNQIGESYILSINLGIDDTHSLKGFAGYMQFIHLTVILRKLSLGKLLHLL